MSSGKRERVMIACVTFEVPKVVSPVKFYEATKVHLLHFGKDNVYEEFFLEVKKQIEEYRKDIEIVDESQVKISDFTVMLNTILKIIAEEKKTYHGDVDIYVNISAGTHEYTAASVIASMMNENVIPFSVPSKEYTVSGDEKVRETYFVDNKPVGLTKSTKDPIRISSYSIPMPDKKLVLGLSILKTHLESRGPNPVSAKKIIGDLAENNLIVLQTNDGSDKPNQNCVMNYQRNFVDKWIALKWVEREGKRSFKITDEGVRILSTFLDSYKVSD